MNKPECNICNEPLQFMNYACELCNYNICLDCFQQCCLKWSKKCPQCKTDFNLPKYNNFVFRDIISTCIIYIKLNDEDSFKELFMQNKIYNNHHYNNILLQACVLYNNVNLLEFLIENKANVNCRNNAQETPLHIACMNNYLGIVRILLKHKANVNCLTNMRLSCVHLTHNFTILNLLYKHHIDLNVQDLHGFTALHEAIYNGNMNKIKWLMNRKVNINLLTSLNETPLDLALDRGFKYIIQYLILKGLRFN